MISFHWSEYESFDWISMIPQFTTFLRSRVNHFSYYPHRPKILNGTLSDVKTRFRMLFSSFRMVDFRMFWSNGESIVSLMTMVKVKSNFGKPSAMIWTKIDRAYLITIDIAHWSYIFMIRTWSRVYEEDFRPWCFFKNDW